MRGKNRTHEHLGTTHSLLLHTRGANYGTRQRFSLPLHHRHRHLSEGATHTRWRYLRLPSALCCSRHCASAMGPAAGFSVGSVESHCCFASRNSSNVSFRRGAWGQGTAAQHRSILLAQTRTQIGCGRPHTTTRTPYETYEQTRLCKQPLAGPSPNTHVQPAPHHRRVRPTQPPRQVHGNIVGTASCGATAAVPVSGGGKAVDSPTHKRRKQAHLALEQPPQAVRQRADTRDAQQAHAMRRNQVEHAQPARQTKGHTRRAVSASTSTAPNKMPHAASAPRRCTPMTRPRPCPQNDAQQQSTADTEGNNQSRARLQPALGHWRTHGAKTARPESAQRRQLLHGNRHHRAAVSVAGRGEYIKTHYCASKQQPRG